MGAPEANTTNIYGIHVRESANDGSDFTNAAADYRVLFLGEDGLLHVKDSSGTVTSPYTGASLTVEDEGTPLATAATTLDFVGSGVTASGTGAEKTITISGGGLIAYDEAETTAGDKTLNSTTWANVDTGLDLSVSNVVAGDILTVDMMGQLGSGNVSAFIDALILNGGSPVRSFGSGEVTTTTGQGIPAWSKVQSEAVSWSCGGSKSLVAASGDINAGTVTVRMRYRTGSATNIILGASAVFPLWWSIKVQRT